MNGNDMWEMHEKKCQCDCDICQETSFMPQGRHERKVAQESNGSIMEKSPDVHNPIINQYNSDYTAETSATLKAEINEEIEKCQAIVENYYKKLKQKLRLE